MLLLVAATVIIGAALAGGVLVAGGLITEPAHDLDRLTSMPPSIAPVAATVTWQSAGDPFIVSMRRSTEPRVSFGSRYQDWVARPDGSGATKLDGAWQEAWSRDGRRLMVATATGALLFADVADEVGPLVDFGLEHPP